ncbi:hypothetical protein ACEWY4_021890 [Coilia grayii]|uniref:C1q domain-containing protein n=1 Tax=Coilia grayii TaxID=363190 RepID=A0ABD1J4G1_9TELE
MKPFLIVCLSVLVSMSEAQTGLLLDVCASLAPITNKLETYDAILQQLQLENAAMKEKLKTGFPEQHKVAFTASLGKKERTGANQKNLVFPNVFTNVGGAYSTTTGFFTAPVKGVYYFRFTVTDILDDRYMGIQMYRNEEKILWLSEYDNDDKRTYIASGATLTLETGDTGRI